MGFHLNWGTVRSVHGYLPSWCINHPRQRFILTPLSAWPILYAQRILKLHYCWEKLFFFPLLASFFSLFLMEVRSRCTFPRVLNAKQVFSSHNTVGLLENTSIITKNSLDEHLWNWELLLWLNRGVREGKRFICTKIVTSVCGVVRLSDASINLYVDSLQL